MRFWDSSAVVPLVVVQTATARMQSLVKQDASLVVWWATSVECTAAVARLEREGILDERAAGRAIGLIGGLARDWHEVDATDPVKEFAKRVLRLHPLRTADALQLAAALVVAEGRPGQLEFVTLDERLAVAARREGFRVVD